MRWLLVSSQHHPTHGGIGTYVARFVATARRAGWTIDLLTRPSACLPDASSITTITTKDMEAAFEAWIDPLRRMERIRPYRYGLWAHAVAERLLTLRGEWDAIEFVDSQAEGCVALASTRVRDAHGGTPMVVHAHTPMHVDEAISGADPARFGRSIYHAWEREAIAAADGVMCTSRRLANELHARHAPFVLPFPIECAPDAPAQQPREETIVLVGTVQPRKGVIAWTESLQRVLRARPRARAILIGPDTPTAPGGTSMAAHLRELVDPTLRDRWEWTGPLPHAQVTALVARAALLVVPSVFESFSFAAVEALDLGTPTLVSDCTGIAEHVPELPTFPTGDVDALVDAQLRILADPVAARQQALAARQSMRTRCSAAEHLRRRIAFLDTLTTGQRVSQDIDALERMSAFLADVEAEVACDSSVRS